MKLGFIIGFFCLSTAFAQTQTERAPLKLETVSDWSVEGDFNAISNSLQPTFGPSIFYAVDDINQIGARFLAPISGPSATQDGTTSVMAVYRHLFSETKTGLIGEITLAENYYNFQDSQTMAPSLGTNLGVIHHYSNEFSFGGLAGGEWTSMRISRDGIETRSRSIYAYARLGVFGNLTF